MRNWEMCHYLCNGCVIGAEIAAAADGWNAQVLTDYKQLVKENEAAINELPSTKLSQDPSLSEDLRGSMEELTSFSAGRIRSTANEYSATIPLRKVECFQGGPTGFIIKRCAATVVCVYDWANKQ